MKNLPRGLRQNNPGNVRHNKNNKWQGLSDTQPDKAFVTFKSMAFGVRASAVTLINYQDKYGISTIANAISRWAPPTENDVLSYINSVAKSTGFSSDEILDFHDYDTMRKLLRAIFRHENGAIADKVVTDAILDEGLLMAGLKKSGISKKQMAAAGTVGVASVAQPVISLAQDNIEVLQVLGVYAPWALAACALAALGYIVWKYWERKKA